MFQLPFDLSTVYRVIFTLLHFQTVSPWFFLSKEIYMILEIWICPLTTWTTGQLPWVVTAPGCPGCSGMSRKMLKWTRHRDVWRTAVLTGVGSKNEMMTFHSFICHAHWLVFYLMYVFIYHLMFYSIFLQAWLKCDIVLDMIFIYFT